MQGRTVAKFNVANIPGCKVVVIREKEGAPWAVVIAGDEVKPLNRLGWPAGANHVLNALQEEYGEGVLKEYIANGYSIDIKV